MIVGFGRLGKAIIQILPTNDKIAVFSRTKEKVLEGMETDARIEWIEPNDFYKEREIWLFLSPEGIDTFLDTYKNYLHPEATIFYCATKGMSQDVAPKVKKKQTIVPVKFITQADQLRRQQKGMAAIPKDKMAYKKRLEHWFGSSMEIVIAEEQDVLILNRKATEKAVTLIMDLQEEMTNERIPKEMIDHAAIQIVPGVIEAYLNHSLGGFAQQVVEERRKRRESR